MQNIGIDLIEINKIIQIGLASISNRILSMSEYQIYKKINSLKNKSFFLAGRWAAKEAIFKTYRKGNLTNNYCDWSILNDKTGAPYIIDKYNNQFMISITHTDKYALAFVIML
ncbi:holo-ACP synthase [Candidatus Phytoplasma bonamiae]|uniref:4'-phosphopantetheinyl transferase superfamily protein n=1 Tax=Candidatus Phytoplasma bonamiae TaxID=2982626 RepID=A0ABT9D480_9MOLU|nr:4'-phosphopantetheinyl transferase superfamily protein ['Bonamia sp.' little leaf phytoplasma]MDO8064251.1 4'-phosphopantetheinyl transferase superfamily protein ['Bonamia sp.' little leaf phytoplasma]MDV3174713.1 4'-phosphopantetheinyl transferase superfamily protein ['Bonamia sp.' little leaf phytoplasma]